VTRTVWGYLVIVMAVAALTALQGEIVAGRAPLPPEWAWLTPVVTAALTAVTTRLRQLGARDGEQPGA